MDKAMLNRDESGVQWTAQLKCTYTSAHGLGNKQEEMESTVQQENYFIFAITEMVG